MRLFVFQRMQSIVRRHLWLALVGAMIPCGGCISCRGIRGGSQRILSVETVPIQSLNAQQVLLLPADPPPVHIPKERCAALCTSSRTPKAPSGCSLPDPNHLACEYTRSFNMAAGRRPAGLRLDPMAAGPQVGAWLAHSASLESAAVIAFAELHVELTLLGAPALLRDACLTARDEEVRHAERMASLARAAGCQPAPPVVSPHPPRTAFQLACDNAVEGCVRESFGALEALWQAHTATDPAIRAAMAQIAEDEARHTELAIALDTWLQDLLTRMQRRDVRQAQHDACLTLQAELAARLPASPALGLLPGALAQRLFLATQERGG